MFAMPQNDTPVEADITQPTTVIDTLKMLVRYKAWANALTFDTVMSLPAGEALRPRPTRFGNMVHTLNHVYVVDDIFRHHLQGRKHGYLARNT
ncbi:DinB family protein, partial [Pseudomonas aeruginosa]